ncbi:MAG: NADH dehydrogenase (quinone) [Candidatus Peregrinibacteria bacterium Gr01-1014_25]|nr:MAG: NADH dehydrogenase (quinone) [Candidatus Peregrinibacteria bacterium Gr01-1014_25]
MITLSSLHNVLVGGLIGAAVLTTVSFRLRAMLRAYALSAICLALLSVSVGLRQGLEDPFAFAVATMLLKVIAIPAFLYSLARHTGAPLRLQSFVRAATTLFVAGLLGAITFFVSSRTASYVPSSIPPSFLTIAIYLILLGFTMMILRRDILSQMIGFLTLENGISMISVITVGSLPLFIEVGVFSAVAMSTIVMSHLFRRIQEAYGAPDSSLLRELVE